MPAEKIEALIKDLYENHQTFREELKQLRNIETWALKQLPVKPGDRARIGAPLKCIGGWKAYREALAVGATGIVDRLTCGEGGEWLAYFTLDRAWTVEEVGSPITLRRHWRGSFETTPKGMQPPGKYEQEHYPEGKKKTFLINVDKLEYLPPDTKPAETKTRPDVTPEFVRRVYAAAHQCDPRDVSNVDGGLDEVRELLRKELSVE